MPASFKFFPVTTLNFTRSLKQQELLFRMWRSCTPTKKPDTSAHQLICDLNHRDIRLGDLTDKASLATSASLKAPSSTTSPSLSKTGTRTPYRRLRDSSTSTSQTGQPGKYTATRSSACSQRWQCFRLISEMVFVIKAHLPQHPLDLLFWTYRTTFSGQML